MEFRIADTFTESLARLTGEEQKAVKITAFDLQMNPEQQRAMLWSMFARVRSQLASQGYVTYAGVFSRLAAQLAASKHLPFDCTVVDEAQDVSVAQLQFLAALGAGQPNSLFFAGDLGQRIFQPPFSWRALGVDIRGRCRILHINYRTSHQIRMQADRLLAPELSDVDGNTEQRVGTISVFNGPPPTIRVLASIEEQATWWVHGLWTSATLA